MIASLLSCIAGFGKKTIACEHYAYGRFNSIARWARNRLYNHMRGLVVLTERDRALFRHHGVRRVWVVENMVSIQPEEWRGHTVHRAMSVGRLDKQKGYDLLLHLLSPFFSVSTKYTTTNSTVQTKTSLICRSNNKFAIMF